MSVAAVAGVIAAITQAMKLSSELAPSLANDVGIWRQAFGTGNNKRQLVALRSHCQNVAAQWASQIEQSRLDLDAARESVNAQLAVFQEKFEADGQITTDEFATLISLQGIANTITASYQRLQAQDTWRQQLAAAGTPAE